MIRNGLGPEPNRATLTLGVLVENYRIATDRALDAGAADALVVYLRKADMRETRLVLFVLTRLVDNGRRSQDALVGAGLVPLLYCLLRNDGVALEAVHLLAALVSGHEAAAVACWEADFVPVLVGLLQTTNIETKTLAVAVLVSLVECERLTQSVASALPLDPLLEVLNESDTYLKMMTVSLFYDITEDDAVARVEAIESGLVTAIIALVRDVAELPRAPLLLGLASLLWTNPEATEHAVTNAHGLDVLRPLPRCDRRWRRSDADRNAPGAERRKHRRECGAGTPESPRGARWWYSRPS